MFIWYSTSPRFSSTTTNSVNLQKNTLEYNRTKPIERLQSWSRVGSKMASVKFWERKTTWASAKTLGGFGSSLRHRQRGLHGTLFSPRTNVHVRWWLLQGSELFSKGATYILRAKQGVFHCPKGGDIFPFLAEDIPIPIPVANIPRVVVWRWNIRFYLVMPIAFWSYPVHLLIFIFCGCFTFCQLKLLFLLVNFLVLASKISNFGPEIDMVWPNFHRIDEIHFGTWVPSGNQTWQWNIHHI